MKDKTYPLYLLFFSFFPALSLMGVNISNDSIDNVIRPIIFSLFFSLIIFLITLIFVRDLNLTGVITLILMVTFYSYGHVFGILDNFRPLGIRLSRNSILILTYLVIVIGGISWVIRKRDRINSITPYLNVITLVLLIFPAFQIISYKSADMSTASSQSKTIAEHQYGLLPETIMKPDIYLLVLDGYNRGDILLNDLNYDNSKFLDDLRSMGFMVVDCSMGNYNQTMLAIASELNLDYIDKYYPGNEVTRTSPITREIFSNNLVRNLLENSGYQTYTFENREWPFMNWENVDHHLSSTKKNVWNREITEFEKTFVESTLLLIPSQYHPEWIEELPKTISKVTNSKSDTNNEPYPYNLAKFMLNTLPKINSEPSPKFVYAHFAVTHIPFYFNADGSLIDQGYQTKNLDYETFIEGYIKQLEFINPQLIKAITEILESSSTPPIIILQSDHGYDQTPEKARFRPNQNLIAIYLPGLHNAPYKSMSSVNIFRYVLNEYFGMNFAYLEDRSYEVSGKDYSMMRIFDQADGCK